MATIGTLSKDQFLKAKPLTDYLQQFLAELGIGGFDNYAVLAIKIEQDNILKQEIAAQSVLDNALLIMSYNVFFNNIHIGFSFVVDETQNAYFKWDYLTKLESIRDYILSLISTENDIKVEKVDEHFQIERIVQDIFKSQVVSTIEAE